jgi:hypothetical protein
VLVKDLMRGGGTVREVSIRSYEPLASEFQTYVSKSWMFGSNKGTRLGAAKHHVEWARMWNAAKAYEISGHKVCGLNSRYTHVLYSKDDAIWLKEPNFGGILAVISKMALNDHDTRPKAFVQDCKYHMAVRGSCSDNTILYERCALDSMGPLSDFLKRMRSPRFIEYRDVESLFASEASKAGICVWRVGRKHFGFTRAQRLNRTGQLCFTSNCLGNPADLEMIQHDLKGIPYCSA